MTTADNTGFPNADFPIVSPTGKLVPNWYQFFRSLWMRTGGGTGGSGFVSGDLKAVAYSGTPSGWLPCNGAAVSRTIYSVLFNVIGTTYGIGDGTTTFNVPNLVGRFPMGASGSHALGASGGVETRVLTQGNLPNVNFTVTDPGHTHVVTDPGHIHAVTDPQHTHGITDPGHVHTALVSASTNTTGTNTGDATAGNTGSATTGVTVNNAATGLTVNSHTTGVTNNSATTGISVASGGAGTALNILNPYQTVNWVIKI